MRTFTQLLGKHGYLAAAAAGKRDIQLVDTNGQVVKSIAPACSHDCCYIDAATKQLHVARDAHAQRLEDYRSYWREHGCANHCDWPRV